MSLTFQVLICQKVEQNVVVLADKSADAEIKGKT